MEWKSLLLKKEKEMERKDNKSKGNIFKVETN